MPSPFWSGFGWGGGEAVSPDEDMAVYGAPKSVQDGLLQIGSQACHILVHRIDSAAAEALRRHNAPRRAAAGSGAEAVVSPGHRLPHGHNPEQYVVLLSDQGMPHARSAPRQQRGLRASTSARSPLVFDRRAASISGVGYPPPAPIKSGSALKGP